MELVGTSINRVRIRQFNDQLCWVLLLTNLKQTFRTVCYLNKTVDNFAARCYANAGLCVFGGQSQSQARPMPLWSVSPSVRHVSEFCQNE